MNKKRKASSPSQREQSDVYSELKVFIASENAKCVKEIKDSNDRSIVAVEVSLSFALDSLAAVTQRQQSADYDIIVAPGIVAPGRYRRRRRSWSAPEGRRRRSVWCSCLRR